MNRPIVPEAVGKVPALPAGPCNHCDMPIYELWIKRAAHLKPEDHLFDSGARRHFRYDELDLHGERLRIVDLHRQTISDAAEGPHEVERLTCIPASARG